MLISLQVVNEDVGFLGDVFLEQLEGEQFDVESVVTPPKPTPPAYIRRLVIPADFTAKVLASEQVNLDFTKQADQQRRIRRGRRRAPAPGAGGVPGRTDPLEHQTGATVTAEDEVRLLALIADPPRVTVNESYAGTGRPVASGAGQSIPGMLTMFVIMTVLIGGSKA